MKKLFLCLFILSLIVLASCGDDSPNANKINTNTANTSNSNNANAGNLNTNTVNSNANANSGNANANIKTNSNAANSANANSSNKESTETTETTYPDAVTALAEGNKLFDNNEETKAAEAFKQAVKMNPDLAEAHFKLGVIYEIFEKAGDAKKEEDAKKEFEKAIKAYQKILAKNPKDEVALFNLGRSYAKISDDKNAIKSLQQAVKINPKEASYKTELGASYNKLAKYDEAVSILKQALKIDPENPRAEKELGTAQDGQKRINFGKKENKDKPKK